MSSRRTFIILFHDSIICFLSFMLAYVLRFSSFDVLEMNIDLVCRAGLLYTIIQTTIFAYFKTYKVIWRFFSASDVMLTIKACSIGIILFFISLFLYDRLEGIPRSLLFIQYILVVVGICSSRLLYRMYREKHLNLDLNLSVDNYQKTNLLLIGLNHNAELFLRAISKNHSGYNIVGIIDLDNRNVGGEIFGAKIFANGHIKHAISKLTKIGKKPQKVIITQNNPDGLVVRQILEQSEQLGLTVAKLPDITELRSADTQFEIKPIVIEDLLGRPQNLINSEKIANLVCDKTVLVTGGGGTIGGELCVQILKYNPKHLIILENSEFNLYNIENILKNIAHNKIKISYVICDIRNQKHVENIFIKFKPNIVYHAAALKHVPILEVNILEAVATNIIGTKIIADCALKYELSTFVLISTDKAVNPVNILGMTKRIAEFYVSYIGKQISKTKFVTVRFGNVLGSSGSVIPLFQKQISERKNITVTHPDVTRYFMTVREAVELVIEASQIGSVVMNSGNSIFVLDMGEPIKIADLAKRMIIMAGLNLDSDVKIEYIGLREGEKLYEELFYKHEKLLPTSNQYIMKSSIEDDLPNNLEQYISSLNNYYDDNNEEKALEIIKNLTVIS
jgi:FlaA1/EpsC-like NDP-sugar epimerase